MASKKTTAPERAEPDENDAQTTLDEWQMALDERDRLLHVAATGTAGAREHARRRIDLLHDTINQARGKPSPASLRAWRRPPLEKGARALRVSIAHRYVRRLLLLVREYEALFGKWQSIYEVDHATASIVVSIFGKQQRTLEAAIREAIAGTHSDQQGSWNEAVHVLEALGKFGSDSTIKRDLRAHTDASGVSAASDDTVTRRPSRRASPRKRGAAHGNSETADD